MKQLLFYIVLTFLMTILIYVTSGCKVSKVYNKPIFVSKDTTKGNWVGGNAYHFHLRAINKARRDSIKNL